jgi:hypothetical protein
VKKKRANRFENNLALLQQFKQEYGDCDVPFQKQFSCSGDVGGAASQVATTATDMCGGDTDDNGNSGADTGEIDATSTIATSSSSEPPPPPCSTIDWKKYDGLGGWVSRMRHDIVKYQNALTRESSMLTGEQVQRLLDVGFVMVPRRNKPPDYKPRFGWKKMNISS